MLLGALDSPGLRVLRSWLPQASAARAGEGAADEVLGDPEAGDLHRGLPRIPRGGGRPRGKRSAAASWLGSALGWVCGFRPLQGQGGGIQRARSDRMESPEGLAWGSAGLGSGPALCRHGRGAHASGGLVLGSVVAGRRSRSAGSRAALVGGPGWGFGGLPAPRSRRRGRDSGAGAGGISALSALRRCLPVPGERAARWWRRTRSDQGRPSGDRQRGEGSICGPLPGRPWPTCRMGT